MALTLRIENETRLPDGGPIEIRVSGRRGIDIGRDSHLDWSLPDPTRYISSRHCEVRFEKDAYVLYDVSTNGTFMNGSDRRMAGPQRLKTGDRIVIGSYIVVAEVDMSDVGDGAKAKAPASRAADPWDVPSSAPPVDRKDVVVPVDRRPVNDPLNWAIDIPDIVPIDRKPPTPRSPPPFPDSSAMAGAGSVDVWNDHRPAAAPMPMPTPPRPPAPQPMSAPARPAPPDEPTDPGETKALPARKSTPAAAPVPAAPEPLVRAARSADLPAASQGPGVAQLLERFAKGAGVPIESVSKRDPGDIMEDVGAMMRLIVENMMDLNAARRETKRAMRSTSHTVVRGQDNNPLKFMPSAEQALMLIFDRPTRAYLSGPKALNESFQDLQIHQKRVFAAMQQALKLLYDDIDPATIDQTVDQNNGMFGSRKVRLWDHFVARWQAKTRKSEDGIVGVFMLYFAECYDKLGEMDSQK